MLTQRRQHLGQAAVLAGWAAHPGGVFHDMRVVPRGAGGEPNRRGGVRSTSREACHGEVSRSSTDQGTLGAPFPECPRILRQHRRGRNVMAADVATAVTALTAAP